MNFCLYMKSSAFTCGLGSRNVNKINSACKREAIETIEKSKRFFFVVSLYFDFFCSLLCAALQNITFFTHRRHIYTIHIYNTVHPRTLEPPKLKFLENQNHKLKDKSLLISEGALYKHCALSHRVSVYTAIFYFHSRHLVVLIWQGKKVTVFRSFLCAVVFALP